MTWISCRIPSLLSIRHGGDLGFSSTSADEATGARPGGWSPAPKLDFTAESLRPLVAEKLRVLRRQQILDMSAGMALSARLLVSLACESLERHRREVVERLRSVWSEAGRTDRKL
jgi:hypothetical protein